MTTVTATDLRSNLYRLLDQVIATGEPLLVKRGQHVIEVRPSETGCVSPRLPLERLLPHPQVLADRNDPLQSPWNEAAWAARWDETRP